MARSASGALTSTSAMCESPSGAARMVAGPRTSTRQPAGAMNVLPATVVRRVSAASTSPAGCAGAVPEMTAGDWRATRVNTRSAARVCMGAPYRISGRRSSRPAEHSHPPTQTFCLVAPASERHCARSRPTVITNGVAMKDFLNTIRYAVRQFRLSPVFTSAAVLTLALGIGGTTAIFTLIHAVMLRSLPVSDPARLYRVGDGDSCCVQGGPQDRWGMFSFPLYERLKAAAPEFEEIAAFQAGGARSSVRREGSEDAARPLRSQFVTG